MKEEKLHIIPHPHQITREDRLRQQGHAAPLLWFTGLSGSGKSTLANELERRLHERGYRTFLLDGDNIRSGLNSDLDFSEASRQENIRRIAEVSKLITDAGCITLSAFISPYARDRAMVRDKLGPDNYLEVYVNCPLEVCEARDVKGLYAKARRGEISNFTGISAPFEAPENPTITVPTHEISLDEAAQRVLEAIEPKIKLKTVNS
ncbi:MAG: adenylyl-sulfate kinase [Schleiferiaceae bacterium]|nr:adenylyl-sulfate kinase [Schleiferiaceae bacterium]MDR9442347.1 adenylyl-sulfate kinase [Schleiferiaceae bacterium]